MREPRIEEPKLCKASEFRHEINRGRYIRNVLSTIILPALVLFSITSCSSVAGVKDLMLGRPEQVPAAPSPFLSREGERLAPRRLPVNRTVQISFEADPVMYAGVSQDGRWLAYSSGGQSSSGLWLRSADPGLVVIPKRITSEGGRVSSPAFSPDGRWIAFSGTGYDVKGDIFLVEIDGEEQPLRRLTGRETEDGAPCFSPDGRTLYFHQAGPGERYRHLAALDLRAPEGAARTVDTGGDCSFPSVSPDGTKVAFVSYRRDPNGDIFMKDFTTGSVIPLTGGPDRDLFPVWSGDGRYVYFSRFELDTDRDGAVTPNDNGIIYRVRTDDEIPFACPVTSGSYSAYQPMISGSNLLFLSPRKGVSNICILPLEGEIPIEADAEAQAGLARELLTLVPPDYHLAILGYYRVLEIFPESYGARATHEIGRLYERMDMPDSAERAFHTARESFPKQVPESVLSGLRVTGIQARREWKRAPTDMERRRILEESISRLGDALAQDPDYPIIQARGRIERADLYADLGRDSQSLLKAIQLLDRVIETGIAPRALQAEAMLKRADLFSRIGRKETLIPAFSKIIREFGDQEEWADQAVSRILELSVNGSEQPGQEESIRLLSRISETYWEELPRLAMGAWNRIGDIYYENDEWAQAKAAYRQVLDKFPVLTTRTAAARLALAEILYREERFRQALDLYETEMELRPYEDHLYHLARAAHIRKSVTAGEYLFRLGEIPGARNIFLGLIREDYSIAEAHRGYIKCLAAQRQLPELLSHYRQELAGNPDDPVTLYATGLCLTYLEEREPLIEARTLIQRAIQQQGQVEYFHQTLGYIFEVLEMVHGEKGLLEAALESYQKAFFLNNPAVNPENRANLLLNLGNVHFLLKQYGKAFANYSLRYGSSLPFDHEETEIIFYKRFGASAFQARDPEQPILAFSKALGLIDRRMDPKRASRVMGSISRYIVDRVITPALKSPESKERAGEFADRQEKLNRGLYEKGAVAAGPPPDPAWEAYRQGMESIISRQEQIIRDIRPLIHEDPDETIQTLSYMVIRARDALFSPLRLMHLKAEMTDRLGLAYQETGRWNKAREAFERTYLLNERLGAFSNLAVNQRSMAYNAYMEAGSRSGREREELLNLASEGFIRVKELIKKYGTREKAEDQEEGALISIDLDVALDKSGSTQAVHGFSAVQEERLADAFISRIQTEQGHLDISRKAVGAQLAEYPPDMPVSHKDLFGVSLLYHRAGHLDFAMKNPLEAFDNFQLSARYSIQMENPVSAAINVRNMARAVIQVPPDDPEIGRCRIELSSLDRRTSRLLDKFAKVLDRLVIPAFHNAMGISAMNMAMNDSAGPVERAAVKMQGMQQAGIHFSQGLERLKGQEGSADRQVLTLLSALHMNTAALASRMGEDIKAQEHLDATLRVSRRGLLPDLQWRALADLGRLDEALELLESVSVLRAGCGQGEIMDRFTPLVTELMDAGEVEEAFNMAELLSEIERVHRLTPLVLGMLNRDDLAFMRRVYPRLKTVHALKARLVSAGKRERESISRRLAQEEEILEHDMERNGREAPWLASFTGTRLVRERLMIVLGLAAHAEELADEIVRQGESAVTSLREQYRDLMDQYGRSLDAVGKAVQGEVPGIAGILRIDPKEAIDVMENLPDNGRCIRLFRVPDRAHGLVAITVSTDDIRVDQFDPSSFSCIPGDDLCVIAYEDPSGLPAEIEGVMALSATHLVRSIENRKPFKRMLTALRPGYTAPEQFQLNPLKEGASEAEFLDTVPGAHTILFNTPVYCSGSVPTRPGQVPYRSITVEMEQDRTLPLLRLSGRLSNASLAVLQEASLKDAYSLGHLFSLFGVPTVLLPRNSEQDSGFVDSFFRAYAEMPVDRAVREAETASGEEWIQLGHWGMSPEKAAGFARKKFSSYVKEGIKAFKAGLHLRAITLFENALNVASETSKLRRYLPDLHRYARESYYMTGRLHEAADHARALVDILARTSPDSEKHARALLNLGLILARAELYGESIPFLEEAVEIMGFLELGPEQVKALSDLGVVLENATEFDRALGQFKSAASLSKELDRKELLARQHTSIGRIYDLRLSSYAQARASYEEAYSIYRELGRKEGAARALLDMGRCSRLLGHFMGADELYKKAMELVEGDRGMLRLKAKIVIEQANNAWYQARYQEAFNLQRGVHTLAGEHGWPLEQIISLNSSGLTWWSLGDNQRALRELEEALALAGELKVRQDEVASTLNNIGLVYREMGQYQNALEALDKALTIDRTLNSRWAIAYDLRNKALTYVRMGEEERAVPLFDEALVTARSIGNLINEAKILLGLGEALSALDRDEEARGSYEDALGLARSMAMRETEWRALYGLGRLRLKKQQREDALILLRQAVSVIEGMRAEIRLDQLKDGFINNKMSVYETLVSTLVDMGRTVEAFDAAERSRARNLIDLMGNQRLTLHGAVEQELYDRQKQLRAEIGEQETLQVQAHEETERVIYTKALKRLNDKYQDLMLEIQAKNPELASLVSVETLTLEGVRALLDPGSALLAFYVLPDEILCWLVRKESVELFRTPIGRETLEQSVMTYRRMIQNLEPFERQSKELYSWLLSRVMPGLDTVRVLGIIPHGPLHYLSFATLYNGESYVADQFPLFYLPSASVFRYTLERRKSGNNRRVLAIGNPDLKDPALDLPFAEREVGSIEWNFPDITLLTREKATESWVVAHMEEFGIIHLASHGEFDPINPLFSAVKLVKDMSEDGDLEASEIFGLRINADLVLLSACQTGLGKVTRGDDVIGMNRAFLYGGSHAILSSLWRVSDISTAILVKQFYRRYVKENKADSLRQAMLHVKNRYSHPGYWGAFVLVGDYY